MTEPEFYQRAELLLTTLTLTGVVAAPTGERIATVLTDVQNVVVGAQHPTPELAAQVEKLLADLGVHGANLHAADEFAAFVKNVQSGQSAIIKGGVTLFGVRGAYEFVPAASDQGKSEGLS